MSDHTSEAIFSEIVANAMSGKSDQLPSADKAIIWAAEEIDRLRALVLMTNQYQNHRLNKIIKDL